MDLNVVSKQRGMLMGIAMLSIMLFHAEYAGVTPLAFWSQFGHWGVDMFFFLSGMGVVYSLKKNSVPQYFSNRVIRLLPPYLLVVAIVGFFAASWWRTLAGAPYWFIRSLLVFYLLAPLLMKALLKWKWYAFWLIIIIDIVYFLLIFDVSLMKAVRATGWYGMPAYVTMSWTPQRLPVFLLGMAAVLMPDSPPQMEFPFQLPIWLVDDPSCYCGALAPVSRWFTRVFGNSENTAEVRTACAVPGYCRSHARLV